MAGAVVIGVGATGRGDDGIGPAIAAALPEWIRAVVSDGDPADLVELLRGADQAILVDAVWSGRPPGTVVVLDPSTEPLPRKAPASSHTLGLAEAIELARALGALPPRTLVVGVEAGDLTTGAPMSEEVFRAIPEAVASIEALLEGGPSPPSPAAR